MVGVVRVLVLIVWCGKGLRIAFLGIQMCNDKLVICDDFLLF